MGDHIAQVVRITISIHPNAEKLEIGTPDGMEWSCVVGKNQFKTGDLAIYIPVDSIVSETFIKKYLSGSKIEIPGGRIRAVKIRQVPSYGLMVPASAHHVLGQDVTEELGITKYEPPEPAFNGPGVRRNRRERAAIKGLRKFVNDRFPVYTHINDIRSYKNVLQDGELVEILEKIHGSNLRATLVNLQGYKRSWLDKLLCALHLKKVKTHQFAVGSHNVMRSFDFKPTNLYWKMAKKYNLEEKLSKVPDMIFFGEVFGSSVQELSYGCKVGEQRLAIFDVAKCNGPGQITYLPWSEVKKLCTELDLPMVPILYEGPWSTDLFKLSEGDATIEGANHMREGFVVKPSNERVEPRCGRVIFKRRSEKYMLSKGLKTEFH